MTSELFWLFWDASDGMGEIDCGDFDSVDDAVDGICSAYLFLINECADDDAEADIKSGTFTVCDEEGHELYQVPVWKWCHKNGIAA